MIERMYYYRYGEAGYDYLKHQEDRVVPYCVRMANDEDKAALVSDLNSLGFKAENSLQAGCPVLLINLDWKRWFNWSLPVRVKGRGGRIMSEQEFLKDVYGPWRKEYLMLK